LKARSDLVRKKKSERDQNFKADMKSIKKEDVRKLQKTFSQFFGNNPDEMSKQSSKLRNKVYFFGFVASFLFLIVFYVTKNVKFIGF
tara:strand:+ start:32 stop:292 length:261 start_codon:yes stop_codon:yes gene_type:complete